MVNCMVFLMQFYLCTPGFVVGHLIAAMALYSYTSPTRYTVVIINLCPQSTV